MAKTPSKIFGGEFRPFVDCKLKVYFVVVDYKV